MNVELLRKVKQHILDEPRRFNLQLWGAAANPDDYNSLSDEWITDDLLEDVYEPAEVLARQRPPCGAVGCIAGNTCIVAGLIKPVVVGKCDIYEFGEDVLFKAAAALEIDIDSAKRLFYLPNWGHKDSSNNIVGWPAEFALNLCACEPGSEAYAAVTGERIEHFIATKGRD